MAERLKARPAEIFALAAILLIGAALRWRHSLAGGFWRDEAQAMDVATLPGLHEMVEFLVKHESHPPLYYFLMRGWSRVVPPGDVPLLLPGLVAGILVIIACWWFGRRIGSPGTGLLAATLIAVSPSAVEADAMVRPYTFLRLLCLMAAALLWKGITEGSKSALAGWVACATCLLYMHNWSLLIVASMTLVGIWLAGRVDGSLPRSHLIVAGALVGLLWLPWLPNLLIQLRQAGHLPPVESLVERLGFVTVFRLPGLGRLGSLALCVGLAGILALRLVRPTSGPTSWPVLRFIGATVVLCIALAVAGSIWSNLLVGQTVAILSPLVLVAFSLLIASPHPAGPFAVVTLFMTLVLTSHETFMTAGTPRSTTDVMARVVASAAQSSDVVLVLPSPLLSSFLRYYHGPSPVEAYPQGVVPSPVRFDSLAARDTDAALIQASAERARRVLERGGKVWEVATDVPPSQRPASLELERMMTRIAGPPIEFAGPSTGATLEQITLRAWGRPRIELQSTDR